MLIANWCERSIGVHVRIFAEFRCLECLHKELVQCKFKEDPLFYHVASRVQELFVSKCLEHHVIA